LGLEHLENNTVVHMDIKEDNIFLIKRENIHGERIVIGDFGTAHTRFIVEISNRCALP